MGALLETKCGMYEPNDVGKENTIKITCIVQKSPRDHEKIISTLRYKIFMPLKSKLCNNNQNFIKFQYNVCLMYNVHTYVPRNFVLQYIYKNIFQVFFLIQNLL